VCLVKATIFLPNSLIAILDVELAGDWFELFKAGLGLGVVEGFVSDLTQSRQHVKFL